MTAELPRNPAEHDSEPLERDSVTKPAEQDSMLTVRDLVNRFLRDTGSLVTSGELTQQIWETYYQTGVNLVTLFGSRLVTDMWPADFERLRKDYESKHDPTTASQELDRIRIMFKYAVEQGLLDPSRILDNARTTPPPAANVT